MTSPSYVNDLASLYTRMYNHPGHERPLNEKFEPSTHPNHEVEEDEDPNWKKLLRRHAKKQQRHMPPTIADVSRDDIPDAEESEENQDVGVGSEFVGKYLDALEKKNVLDDDDAHEVRKARKLIEHNIEGVMNYYKHLLQRIEQERSDQGALDALQQLKTHIQHQFNQYNQWGAPEDYDFKEL
tara:strand:- start:178 stop:726 length:549 start_codon:yes stop_codon:yes gene_type:complete